MVIRFKKFLKHLVLKELLFLFLREQLFRPNRRTVVSQNYFTTQHPTLVRKLTNKKIRWIIKQLEKGTPVKEIATVMRVTPRRIYQIKKQYEETGKIPELRQPGRKPKQIDRKTEQIILQAYNRYRLSPVLLEKLIERDYGIHIPHNTIYKVLLKNNLVEENMKKKRRKWVRYERKHSMSLWQGDWKRLDDEWIIASWMTLPAS